LHYQIETRHDHAAVIAIVRIAIGETGAIMTTTQLAAEIKAVLKPTAPRQLAVSIRKKVLVEAHLKLMELLSVTSPQPACDSEIQDESKIEHA
jgi:hypothetical protein